MCVQFSIYYLNHFIEYQLKFLLLVPWAHWNKRLLVLVKTLCIQRNCVCKAVMEFVPFLKFELLLVFLFCVKTFKFWEPTSLPGCLATSYIFFISPTLHPSTESSIQAVRLQNSIYPAFNCYSMPLIPSIASFLFSPFSPGESLLTKCLPVFFISCGRSLLTN